MANSAQIWEDYLLNFQASGGALSVNVNGGPYVSTAGAVGGYQTVANQQLAILPQAAAVRIDNPTPFLIFLPEQNIQVGPGVTGMYFVFPVPIQRVNVQIQWIANTPVQSFAGAGGGLNTVIRYYQTADGPPTGGTTQAQGIAVFDQDYSFNFVSTPYAAQLFSNAPNGKHSVSGYDSGTGDGRTIPARTANVWALLSKTQAASNSITSSAYTAPAGKKWRLLALRLLCDLPGPAGSIAAAENGGQVTAFYAFEGQWAFPAGGARGYREVRYRGNGLQAAAASSALTVVVSSGAATLTFLSAEAELYVGPP